MSRFGTILLVLLALGAGLGLFLVEPRWKSTREAAATRDAVLHFDPGAVTGIRVATGDEGFELTRQADGWWIGPKPRDAASPKLVGELLKAAGGMRVFDVIRGAELRDGRDLEDFGLAKPKSQFDLMGDGQPALYFGKEAAGDGRIYVRRADSGDVFVVSDELQRRAFRSAEDFRDRRLTNLAPDRIDAFTIKRGTGEIALERNANGWEILRPLRARADDARVDRLLAGLLGLEILDFVADESDDLSAYGLGEPLAEVVFKVEEQARPVALRIGGEVARKGAKAVLAQYTARDSVYHLPTRALTMLRINPDDLRDRRLMTLNLDIIDAIRLRTGAKSWTVERADHAWKSGARVVKNAVVEKAVRNLSEARVEKYLPLTTENLRRAGLENPAGEISFDAWLSENTPETTAGRRAVLTLAVGAREGGNVHVRVDDNPEICVIPAAAVDGLNAGEAP